MRSMIKMVATTALVLAASGEAVAVQHPAVERALGALRGQPKVFKTSAGESFLAREVIVDADGTEHVRFDRRYQGLPVIGGDVVVHSNAGRYRGASLTLPRPLQVDTVPAVPADEAIVIAGAEFGPRFQGTPVATLVVYARGRGANRLAWQVQLQDSLRDMTYFVDAHKGVVIDRWSDREYATATGTARTLYSGSVPMTTNSLAAGFELRDPSRGGSTTIDASNSRTSGQVYTDADNTWGNHTVADVATAAADAHYGAGKTWDYFRSVHGRNGIAGDGRGARTRVHYGRRYSNAFWNDGCFCMTYGDGDGVNVGPLVSLDIAAHEMAHGVTSRTAGLVYSGESGGLNEATSDIFGAMVEFHAANTLDTPDYLIGEEILLANVSGAPDQRGLRYMFNPAADGRSRNCWSADLGTLGVHFSSGVGNRFFYLLAEGSGARTYSGVNHKAPTCNGGSVTGIGRAKAQRIWYRALTVYFTSTTDYAGARAATVRAATDLYGAASPEATAVAAAWAAVNVL